MPNTIKIPQLHGKGARKVELGFPESWHVTVSAIAGADKPGLNRDQIKSAIASPTGTPPLRTLARGKRAVAILFDDTTRLTRVAEIVPFILEELAQAGVSDNRIRFIAALGAHGAMD